MEETQWLSQTTRVYGAGQILIKKDIVDALQIEEGSLVEIRVRNTGIKVEKSTRGVGKKGKKDDKEE